MVNESQKKSRILDLSKDLHIGSVNEGELNAILLFSIGGSTHPTGRSQRFAKPDSSGFLELTYSKAGAIQSAMTDMTSQQIQALSDHIAENLIENQNVRIGQAICFSNEWIKGAFRYEDHFQILPPDPSFPDVPVAIADHPFLLQFRFTTSPNPTVNNMRRQPIVNQIISLLNVLSRSGVQTAPRYTDFCWCIDLETNPMTTRWMQQGYFAPANFAPQLDEFSQIENVPPIQLVPVAEYYKHGFSRSSDPFALPQNIGELLSKVGSLPIEQRRKFDLACTWLSMSVEIATASSSASYISMIAAIEALLDKKAEICPTCHQPKYSIAKRLKDLLKQFVPGIARRKEQLNQIYEIRSHLAHGLELLLSDLGHSLISGPGATSEMMMQHDTRQIVRSALINWLQQSA